jgi:O-antigen biosynthesis protein WbqP
MIRLFNIAAAILAFVVFLIPMIFVVIAVKMTSKGPALYWSDRVGKENKIFSMPKFRSMRVDAPALATHLIDDSASLLTPIGGFLRNSSLDELPQIWCILIGTMNIVGPRPALFNQDDLVALRTECGVHRLKPGLTGWAQINGRDDLSIPDKVTLDHEYLERRSFAFDLVIIWKTAIKVIKRAGISH